MRHHTHPQSSSGTDTPEFPTDQSIDSYHCPYCDMESSTSEYEVRTHISSADDASHKGISGFEPGVTVTAYNMDGEPVEKHGIQLSNPAAEGSVSTTLLPRTLIDAESTPRAQAIVLTALRNPTASYAEIQSKVNDKLDTSVSYQTVYSTLNRYLPNRQNPLYNTMSAEDKTFDDLTPKQQRVLFHAYRRLKDGSSRGEWTYADIAADADVDASYPSDVLDDFSHVLDNLEDDGADLDMLEQRMTPLEDEYTPPPVGRLRESAPAVEDVPAYDDLSENAQEIVDAFAATPDETVESVVESTRFNEQAVSEVREKVLHIIAEERAKRTSEEELQNRYNRRTDPQKNLIRELSREPVPTRPARFKKDIADAADAGSTYINYVVENFLELVYAVKLGKLDIGIDISEHQITPSETPDDIETTAASVTATDEPEDSSQADELSTEPEDTLEPDEAVESTESTETDSDVAEPTSDPQPPESDATRHLREQVLNLKARVESLNNVATAQYEQSNDDVALGQKVATDEILKQLDVILDDESGSTAETSSTRPSEPAETPSQ